MVEEGLLLADLQYWEVSIHYVGGIGKERPTLLEGL